MITSADARVVEAVPVGAPADTTLVDVGWVRENIDDQTIGMVGSAGPPPRRPPGPP